METALTRSQFVRWRAAVFAIFLVNGVIIATWAARVPDIKAALGVGNSAVGMMLLFMGIASIVGLTLSPLVMARIGARRGMLAGMVLEAAGMAILGLGATALGSYPLAVIGLVLMGFGMGAVDVMMNVEATAIEQHAGRTLLPLFHAFFSFGTVLGAGIGWAAAGLALSVTVHALAIAAIVLACAVVSIAQVPDREATQDPEPAGTEGTPARRHWRERLSDALSAWREPRTYALGIIMLGMSFAEGGANDWMALGVSEDHGAGPAVGAAVLTVFAVCMTLVRIVGGPLVDRFGRVLVLRLLAVAATAGILLFVFAPSLPFVFLAAALWGVGASLGFPLGMSAAADDPARAAARVSAVATIGYIAFLGGPPILGVVSEHIDLLNTLLILAVLVIASGLASGAARPLEPARPAPEPIEGR